MKKVVKANVTIQVIFEYDEDNFNDYDTKYLELEESFINEMIFDISSAVDGCNVLFTEMLDMEII